jgi:hypothetical protein
MIPENVAVQRWPAKKRAAPKVVIASLAAAPPYSPERVVSVVTRAVSVQERCQRQFGFPCFTANIRNQSPFAKGSLPYGGEKEKDVGRKRIQGILRGEISRQGGTGHWGVDRSFHRPIEQPKGDRTQGCLTPYFP